MKTQMVSLMKAQKDAMGSLMSQAQRIQLIETIKTTGDTHLECSTVIGHPNFVEHTRAWVGDIRNAGLKVTWRNAHQNMEGLYGAEKFVGVKRKPAQFWIDEAVNAFNQIKDLIQPGDEEAIYPERTEGIFQDTTSFLPQLGLPTSYADFFINLHNALKVFSWTVGLSANNASELLSGWMPRVLIDYAGVAVVDHYVDGNPDKYEADIRSIFAKYGKPVYVQEGAPHRTVKPTREQCDAYYAVNKKLEADGVLVGFGSWSGWAGTPESIVDYENGKFVLNDHGKSLKAWWNPETEPPTPTPEPERLVQIFGSGTTFNGLTNLGNVLRFASGKWTKLPKPL